MRPGNALLRPTATTPDPRAAEYNAAVGVTTPGGAVSQWETAVHPPLPLSQGVALRRPTSVLADARFNGQPSVQFSSAADVFVQGAAAADWTYLSNGAGATVHFVWYLASTATFGVLFDTGPAAFGDTGLTAFADDPFTLKVAIANTGVSYTLITLTMVPDAAATVVITVSAAALTATAYQGGVAIDTQSAAPGALAAGPPAGPLALGESIMGASGTGWDGPLPLFETWAYVLSAPEIAALVASDAATYGV